MKQWIARLLLGISGALLLFIGTSVLIGPASFAAGNGIALPNDPSLLSEVRAPGGMLVASAIFLLLSAARARHLRLGFALSTLVYGSYGMARLVGVAIDGLPSTSLTQAMIVELVVGAVCLAAAARLAARSTPERY